MTLIVSVRVPDGIVIAADSLSTAKEEEQSSAITFSHAQKIFPFYEKYGVGIFGAGLIANESVFVAMRLFEQDLKEKETSFKGVSEVAQEIGNYFHNLLQEQLETENKSLDFLQPGQYVYGFHVVGYDDADPKTVEVHVGKNINPQIRKELGCTYTGNGEIVQAIWELYKTDTANQPPYPLFSLQDAMDYAEFLIRTTTAHQQFSKKRPDVGGNIDIAIVTFFGGFQWIRQKPLNQILEGN
jgi:20S proteasome alpha/beta subunit